MSLIYQKTNYENENKIKFIKNIIKHDKYEINKNENKISSSSNNFYHIHSAKVSNVENVEKNININSKLIGSDCNYAINSNNGSNMFALYSKNGNQKMNENLSLINSQNSNDNQKFLSLVESHLNENNQNENENHQNLNENNQNENENLQNLNENNQNENENNQNLNENHQNLNENHLNENDYFQ